MKIRISPERYREIISVNGQAEFEEKWSLSAKVFGQFYFALCRIETFFVRWFFLICIRPFLGEDNPKRNDPRLWPVSLIFFTPGTGAMEIKRQATTWYAIEYIYTWTERVKKFRGIHRILTNFLGSVENVLATRNRLRNLKREMFWEVYNRLRDSDSQMISIVSLASGSARASIEVVSGILKDYPHLLDRFELYFVDADPAAYDFAVSLAKGCFPGLEEKIKYWQTKISGKPEGLKQLADYLALINPIIVEMVGFADYMADEKAISIFKVIWERLPVDGLLLTNNVKPNNERTFLETVVTWRMRNRTEAAVYALLKAAGFSVFRQFDEPTDIQPVYAARKTG